MGSQLVKSLFSQLVSAVAVFKGIYLYIYIYIYIYILNIYIKYILYINILNIIYIIYIYI